jgi:hypothetical protein
MGDPLLEPPADSPARVTSATIQDGKKLGSAKKLYNAFHFGFELLRN